MTKEEFVKIRKELKLTQEELSQVLVISKRAVQSYEQGWRRIVPTVERNLYLILMLHRQKGNDRVRTCWEISNCSDEQKEACTAWKLQVGHLCWYITGTRCCCRQVGSWSQKIKRCRECLIFKELFRKPNRNRHARKTGSV